MAIPLLQFLFVLESVVSVSYLTFVIVCSSSVLFCASGRLCFVIVAFLIIFTYTFGLKEIQTGTGTVLFHLYKQLKID